MLAEIHDPLLSCRPQELEIAINPMPYAYAAPARWRVILSRHQVHGRAEGLQRGVFLRECLERQYRVVLHGGRGQNKSIQVLYRAYSHAAVVQGVSSITSLHGRNCGVDVCVEFSHAKQHNSSTFKVYLNTIVSCNWAHRVIHRYWPLRDCCSWRACNGGPALTDLRLASLLTHCCFALLPRHLTNAPQLEGFPFIAGVFPISDDQDLQRHGGKHYTSMNKFP